MNKISSATTAFRKKGFPSLWFGGLALFTIATALGGAIRTEPMFLVIPIALAAFGVLLMKTLVWDLVDEVPDHGSYLLVRNRGEEDRIPLTNIVDVTASRFTNPVRITLLLSSESKFGDKIVFTPVTRFTLNPFSTNQIAEKLLDRIYNAKSRSSHGR